MNGKRTRRPSVAIGRELRSIQDQHAGLADDNDAADVMRRLATLRVRFRELAAAIDHGGGAPDNLELVSELRQCSRSCSTLERQLGLWLLERGAPAVNPWAMFARIKQDLLTREDIEPEIVEGAELRSAALVPRRPSDQ